MSVLIRKLMCQKHLTELIEYLLEYPFTHPQHQLRWVWCHTAIIFIIEVNQSKEFNALKVYLSMILRNKDKYYLPIEERIPLGLKEESFLYIFE